MYNKMNGYAPFRSSGGRMWGMSHSLPSGMSRYAYQDTDFTTSYPTARRMYDYPPNSSSMMGGLGGGGGCGGGGGNNGGGFIGHMSSSSTSSLQNAGNCGTNLIINYLPQDMTDRELYALFQPMGPIGMCRIMRDYKNVHGSFQTGYSYGYAFINFVTEDSAQRAIKCLNGITVRNKRLKVSYARPQGDELRDTNLYVTNLPRTITEDQLDIIFGKYGTIVQKNILRDKITGKPRGVAFVRFNKREEAQEAISALNNVIPEGGNQPLTVRVAEEHGKHKANTIFGAPPPLSQFTNAMHRGRSRVRFPKMAPY